MITLTDKSNSRKKQKELLDFYETNEIPNEIICDYIQDFVNRKRFWYELGGISETGFKGFILQTIYFINDIKHHIKVFIHNPKHLKQTLKDIYKVEHILRQIRTNQTKKQK